MQLYYAPTIVRLFVQKGDTDNKRTSGVLNRNFDPFRLLYLIPPSGQIAHDRFYWNSPYFLFAINVGPERCLQAVCK